MSNIIQALARRMSRNDSSVRVPKAPQMSQHLGTLAAVDPNTNTVHITHNGTGQIIPGVPVMQAYSPNTSPSVNDVVVYQMYGPTPMVVGYLSVPTNVVTP